MKRPISILVGGFLLLASSTIPAQIDTNANTLSDLWERKYNSGELFPNTFDPTADPDEDGWNNAQEAVAGTDPFDPNPPNGFLRPAILNIPAVFDEPDSNGDPVLLSPNAIRVSWQTIPGKKYTLLYSPNLESTSWLPVEEPFIGTDSITEYNFPLANPTQTFWRVRIEDTDSDGDGLTDAEENQLGLNAANPDTDGDGVRDKVEITNGTDPKNPDTDGDGLTDGQEIELGTDPKVPDNPGILQEAIKNGDFSDPVIGTGARANASWKKWDYWPGVPGWTAVIGNNVEYQIIEPLAVGNQYCELKAEPALNNSIQQIIGTVVGKSYLIVLDCKARADTDLADNDFDIRWGPGTDKANWTTVKSVTFTNHDWTTVVANFTATSSITTIALIAKNYNKPTRGSLVDNLRLLPVQIRGYSHIEELDDVGTVKGKYVREIKRNVIVDQTDYTGFKTEVKTELKIALWSGQYLFDDNNNSAFDHNYFKQDLDVFRIRLPDIPPPLGTTEHRIKIWTVDAAGIELDAGAVVDLNIKDGFHETAALCLVTDDPTDDAFAVEGKADGALGDRTYRAVLGGKLKFQWLTFPDTVEKPIFEIPILVKKTVTAKGYNVDESTNSAEAYFDRAKKVSATCGVKLDYTIVNEAAPADVSFASSEFTLPDFVGDIEVTMTQESKSLIDGLKPPAGVIPIYFVKNFNQDLKGWANTPSRMAAADSAYGGAVFLDSAQLTESTLAHEFLHILLDASHGKVDPLWSDAHEKRPWCLWYGSSYNPHAENGISARRRILETMRTRILKSNYCK